MENIEWLGVYVWRGNLFRANQPKLEQIYPDLDRLLGIQIFKPISKIMPFRNGLEMAV